MYTLVHLKVTGKQEIHACDFAQLVRTDKTTQSSGVVAVHCSSPAKQVEVVATAIRCSGRGLSACLLVAAGEQHQRTTTAAGTCAACPPPPGGWLLVSPAGQPLRKRWW